MLIGFDVSQTGRTKAGCGYFADAMIRALVDVAPERDYCLYSSFGDFFFDQAIPRHPCALVRNVRFGPNHASREEAGRFWNDSHLDEAIGHPAIVQANNFWCPIQPLQGRLVYTLYDLGFAEQPWWTTEENRVGCFDGIFRSAVAADWVVAISEASRAHYLRTFPAFPTERIRVIHPCSRFKNTDARGTMPASLAGIAPGHFWLCVGTIEPRKNQHRLVQAYARYLAGGGAAMPLVIAGGEGWLMSDFRDHLAGLGIAAKVVMTGYVSDDELTWLYRNCFANLYPSLFEGFGLPILEGMQHGAATLTSTSTSLPEVAGAAAILLDPLDTDAWASAMLRLAADPAERARLQAAARDRAATFSWEASARKLLALYDEAVDSPKRPLL